MSDTAIFDVDGTLVDSNYQHAMAWQRAFRRFEVRVPVWRIHRAIGMGGDMLVPTVAGHGVERAHGDELREAWVEEFDDLIGSVAPFDGARDLLHEVKRRGFILVLASSGRARHVEALLDLVDGRSLADAWTTSDDAAASKPEPDLVATALEKVGGEGGVMVGDSTWDVVAASRLGVPTIAVRSGGYSVGELHEAGAVQVFTSLVEFLAAIEGTSLARPTAPRNPVGAA